MTDIEKFRDKMLKNLVFCVECKYAHLTVDGKCKYCSFFNKNEYLYLPAGSFCSNGERKTGPDTIKDVDLFD